MKNLAELNDKKLQLEKKGDSRSKSRTLDLLNKQKGLLKERNRKINVTTIPRTGFKEGIKEKEKSKLNPYK